MTGGSGRTAVFLTALLSAQICAHADPVRNFSLPPASKEGIVKKASLEKRQGLSVLHVAGTPYEIGYQHGALLKDDIKEFLSNKILPFLKSEEEKHSWKFFPHIPLTQYFRARAQSLERYMPKEYRDELKGLSDGCGLGYEDILLINTFFDTAAISQLEIPAEAVNKLKEKKIVIFYKPETGNIFAAAGCPGMIGAFSGMNEKGIAEEEKGADKVRDFEKGVPTLMLLRQSLQYSNSFYDSIRIIASSPRTIKDSIAVFDTRIKQGCLVDFDAKHYDVTLTGEEIAAQAVTFFEGLRDEFGTQIGQGKPIDPFEFYSYEKAVPDVVLEEKDRTNEYRHCSFSYPSVVDTDYPENTVFMDFYEPIGLERYPAVIFLSHITGSVPQIEGEFCRDLASNGIAVLLVQTAYQKNYRFCEKWLIEKLKERGADEIIQLLRQLVIEARRGIDWLETQPKVEKDKIGVMGVSLGGIAAPIVAGVDGRVNSMAIVLGGGDMGEIIWNSFMTKLYKKRLVEEGIDSPYDLEKKMWMLDPLTFAFKAKAKSAIMINANVDIDVPRSSTLKLWRALEKPQLVWVPTGHFTSLFVIGYAKIKTFQYFYSQLVDKDRAKRMGLEYSPGNPVSSFRFPSMKNLAGGRIDVNASADYASEAKSLKLGVIAKELFDKPYFGGTEVFGRNEGDNRYKLQGVGGAMLFGRRLTESSNFYLRYSYEAVNVHNVDRSAPSDFQRHDGRSASSTVSANFERSTLDDRLYPIDGSYTGASLGVASEVLGGHYNFIRATGEGRWYITTPYPKITFAFRLKGGWMGEYGDSGDVPFFERFYLSTSDTVRGYKLRSIGPQDSSGLPLGGNVLLLGNIETRFPVYKGLNGALFYDVGGEWERLSRVRIPHDLKNSVGAGLRYRTKWTVLRIDYGYPLNRNPGKREGRFSFALGVPF